MNLADLELAPDHLHLFVFGPGYDESILVRVPPDDWIAVDSLRCQTQGQDRNPALELLRMHGATLAAIALTHPHRDHARGLVGLFERRRAGGPVGCSELILDEQRGTTP